MPQHYTPNSLPESPSRSSPGCPLLKECLAHSIGIMDGSKLISLSTLQELRSSHGESLVMKQVGDLWEYVFFPSLAAANIFLDQQHDKTGMEDIFLELTGRQLD